MSMAVYACDKSVPLAACNTSNGRLLCEERLIYGGTSASPLNGTRFDEPGYIAIRSVTGAPRSSGLRRRQT